MEYDRKASDSHYKNDESFCKHQLLDYCDIIEMKSNDMYCKECGLHGTYEFFKRLKHNN